MEGTPRAPPGGPMPQEAKQKSSQRMKEHRAAIRNWDSSQLPEWLTAEFFRDQIQPALTKLSSRELAEAIGVRPSYVSGMKRGEDVAHPRFWLKLVEVLALMPKPSSQA